MLKLFIRDPPLLEPTEAANVAGIAVDGVKSQMREETESRLRCIGAAAIASAQHDKTLAWIRERIADGEHLDDLLG